MRNRKRNDQTNIHPNAQAGVSENTGSSLKRVFEDMERIRKRAKLPKGADGQELRLLRCTVFIRPARV